MNETPTFIRIDDELINIRRIEYVSANTPDCVLYVKLIGNTEVMEINFDEADEVFQMCNRIDEAIIRCGLVVVAKEMADPDPA